MPFWKTKPVAVSPLNPASLSLIQTNHGFQPDPDPPPSSALEWDAFSLDDPEKLTDYHRFLTDHYKTHGFPFQIVYTLHHLQLELSSPWNRIVVLRSIKTKAIVAGIAGGVRSLAHTFPTVPHNALQEVLMIGFLCIHPAFRNLHLAPALIHEISRCANQSPYRIQKAYYNSTTELPGCFCSTPNLSRPINLLNCLQTGYIQSPPPAVLDALLHQSIPVATPWRFHRLSPASPSLCTESVEVLLNLVNAYNDRHRKVYEPLTRDRWNQLCAATDCADVFVVSQEDSTHPPVGLITTVRHPYLRVGSNPPQTLHTVLVHYYGFAEHLTPADQHAIWDAFFRYATATNFCDVISLIHPDIADAFTLGFAKTHVYHHYMYNVSMVPLSPKDITMIGI